MARIFLSGATGVIGRRLVPLLVQSGHDVTGVARNDEKSLALAREGARPARVDIFDPAAVIRAVEGHDVVINMATHIPPTSKVFLPGAFKENNRIRSEASRNLSRAATTTGATRFIQESFAPVYPDRGSEWIDETVPIEPARYVLSVVDAERAASDFTASGGVGIALRFGFFYSPDSDMIRDAVKAVKMGIAPMFGDPDGYQSSIWLDDAASAVVAALNVPAGVYNVADNHPMTRRAAYNALAHDLGVKPPKFLLSKLTKILGDVAQTLGRSLRLSNHKLRLASGWAPSVPSVKEGWPLLLEQMNPRR